MRRPVPEASFLTSSFFSSTSGDLEDVVGHRGDVRGGLVDRVQHLVVEVAAHELVDAVVERGAEQHALSGLRGLVHDAGDDRQEAEVGHVVGLVEHGDLDGVEVHEALLHEVLEAAGAGNDDVDAGLEGRDLALLRDATEDRGDVQAVGGGERLHDRGDLGGELAGRGEHEAERASGRRLPPASAPPRRATIGIEKARVLPEPVLPRPSTSRPARVSGRVSSWMGNGSVNAAGGERSDEGSGHAERAEGVFLT